MLAPPKSRFDDAKSNMCISAFILIMFHVDKHLTLSDPYNACPTAESHLPSTAQNSSWSLVTFFCLRRPGLLIFVINTLAGSMHGITTDHFHSHPCFLWWVDVPVLAPNDFQVCPLDYMVIELFHRTWHHTADKNYSFVFRHQDALAWISRND